MVRESMDRGYAGYQGSVLNKATTLTKRFNKETRRQALRMMREDHGITGQLEDRSCRELELLMRFATYLNDEEDAVGKL